MRPVNDTASDLSYQDVQIILALLDGWKNGHIRFRHKDLSVQAITSATCANGGSGEEIIRSPAVGFFEPSVSVAAWLRNGEVAPADAILGWIVALGRRTPVVLPFPGIVTAAFTHNGGFVEYGGPLFHIASGRRP
jgi:biotin carboxyl carrier protein